MDSLEAAIGKDVPGSKDAPHEWQPNRWRKIEEHAVAFYSRV